MSENVLTIRDLSIDYETDRGVLKAMRHVNLDIPRGSIVGVVGESGCGKSTLISSIIRLLAPNAKVPNGSIVFEDQDLLKLSADQMRALRGTKLSIVFQDPMSTLNPVFSNWSTDDRYSVPRQEDQRTKAATLYRHARKRRYSGSGKSAGTVPA